MSAWNEPELLNSTLKCNFCDQLQFDMTLRYYFFFNCVKIKKCLQLSNLCHSYHCGIVYQHAKYHYYMSVTFSLSLPNEELIRVHMF